MKSAHAIQMQVMNDSVFWWFGEINSQFSIIYGNNKKYEVKISWFNQQSLKIFINFCNKNGFF